MVASLPQLGRAVLKLVEMRKVAWWLHLLAFMLPSTISLSSSQNLLSLFDSVFFKFSASSCQARDILSFFHRPTLLPHLSCTT